MMYRFFSVITAGIQYDDRKLILVPRKIGGADGCTPNVMLGFFLLFGWIVRVDDSNRTTMGVSQLEFDLKILRLHIFSIFCTHKWEPRCVGVYI